MQRHELFEDLFVAAEDMQGVLFLFGHQPAVCRHIGGQDRRQLAFEAFGYGVGFGHCSFSAC